MKLNLRAASGTSDGTKRQLIKRTDQQAPLCKDCFSDLATLLSCLLGKENSPKRGYLVKIQADPEQNLQLFVHRVND
jgi:hypothetical protein